MIKDKKKIDILSMIGPLDSPPEAKTIDECYAEAGGFPFTIKRLIDSGECFHISKAGTVLNVTGKWQNGYHYKFENDRDPETGMPIGLISTHKMWMLLGHIPKDKP